MTKKKSTLIIRIVLAVGTIASLFLVPWILLKAFLLPLPDTIQGQVDQAIDLGFEGIIVYVDVKGEPPAFYAAGWHDPKKEIPAYPEALFKLASVSKLYHAVAITKLVNEGRLSLDKTVADYFPEYKDRIENADKITLRMMVQHRSGIPNFTNLHNYWAAPKTTNKERIELMLDKPASFEPDEDYEYSNTNYALIAELMDKTLGYNRYEYFQKEIFDPLNLKHTYASVAEVNMDSVMSGYHVGYPLDLKGEKQGMLATAQDVGTFLRALNDGSLLNGREQEIYSSIYTYEHTGLIPGYQTIAKYHQDIDAVVIEFTTPTYFEGYNWNLAEINYKRIVKILKKKLKKKGK